MTVTVMTAGGSGGQRGRILTRGVNRLGRSALLEARVLGRSARLAPPLCACTTTVTLGPGQKPPGGLAIALVLQISTHRSRQWMRLLVLLMPFVYLFFTLSSLLLPSTSFHPPYLPSFEAHRIFFLYLVPSVVSFSTSHFSPLTTFLLNVCYFSLSSSFSPYFFLSLHHIHS
jgi:hypothetical protein